MSPSIRCLDVAISTLTPNKRNARTHSRKQIRQISRSIQEFGFTNPLLVDESGTIIAGHGRFEAALSLGLSQVPAITIVGLSEARKRALMLADNKIASNAGWDREKLAIEIPELTALLEVDGTDISVTGFEIPEIDQLMVDFEENSSDAADTFEAPSTTAISQPGDLWVLGPHRLLCGNARSEADLDHLMAGKSASMAFDGVRLSQG